MGKVFCPHCGSLARLNARSGDVLYLICTNSWKCGYTWSERA